MNAVQYVTLLIYAKDSMSSVTGLRELHADVVEYLDAHGVDETNRRRLETLRAAIESNLQARGETP